MYPVSANFHTLAIQDAPKTRVRIYFIGDAVDCTDDNAVQTNGTLLIGKAGDTDSNGRIGQNGITFSEFFNPDKNIQVGAAVSSQIGMTLLNTDGALDNFQYGRCKVYLDVYDAANSSWLTCPMGVYIIDLPTKRKVQLVNATGYDQMQKLDEICDTWWSALNWSGGITLSQLLTSLATQIGVSVSSNTASAIVNGSVSFTEEPFQCIEVTYREVLEYIAEATGTVARFDRNGALDLRWFAAAQISGNTVTVNTDTVGNQCLAISVAEYSVAAVDLLKVKLYTDDIGTTVGTGTNQYTIVNNLFLDGANSAAIIAKATPIYNRIHGLGAYSPVSARVIMDWSIEAGDIINIVNGGTTYSVPIFQQSMAWRGGYVVSDLLSDGDNVRPVLDYDERTYYRLNSEMSKKVGDNEIISKINQSPESITIQANKVNLTGYVTFTNLSTSGQTSINGGNITTGTISADRIAAGSLSISKLDSATQNTITTAASDASTALSNAATAQSTANSANSQEQLIYISKVGGTTTQSATTTWVTDTTGNQNTWTIKRPTYNSSYPVLFVATQRKNVAGTVTCTTPQIDNTTTVIDGGHITTGTIDAGVVNVANLDASNITTGTLSADYIRGGSLTIGGTTNQYGKILIYPGWANPGNLIGEFNASGFDVYSKTTYVDGNNSETYYGRAFSSGGYFSIGVKALSDSTFEPIATVMTSADDLSNPKGQIKLWEYSNANNVASVTPTNAKFRSGDYIVEANTSSANSKSYLNIFAGWGIIDGKTRQKGISLDANGSTFDSVIDVTPRRCYAALSSAGWYRVMDVNTQSANSSRFAIATIVDINIGTSNQTVNNGTHKISLHGVYDNPAFVGEESRSNYMLVDKVRYTYDTSGNGHIDIYYNSSSANPVWCSFAVHTPYIYQSLFVAKNMTYMGATVPANETVLKEYTFHAQAPMSDVSSLVTWNTTNYIADASGMKVYLDGRKLIFTGQLRLKTGISFQGIDLGTLDSSIAAVTSSFFMAAYASDVTARAVAHPITIYMSDSTTIRAANEGPNTNYAVGSPTANNYIRFNSVIPLA